MISLEVGRAVYAVRANGQPDAVHPAQLNLDELLFFDSSKSLLSVRRGRYLDTFAGESVA